MPKVESTNHHNPARPRGVRIFLPHNSRKVPQWRQFWLGATVDRFCDSIRKSAALPCSREPSVFSRWPANAAPIVYASECIAIPTRCYGCHPPGGWPFFWFDASRRLASNSGNLPVKSKASVTRQAQRSNTFWINSLPRHTLALFQQRHSRIESSRH
jgi:hypothetical protein